MRVATAAASACSQAADVSGSADRIDNNRDNPAQAAAEAKQGLAQLMDKAKSSGALAQKAEEVSAMAGRRKAAEVKT